MKKEIFSYFLPPVSNTTPERDLTLREVWEYISGRDSLDVQRRNKSGGLTPLGTLQRVTERVRSLSKEDYNSKTKGKVQYLPLVTFGGVFSQRKGDGLQMSSGLINLDIDHLSGLGLNLQELKQKLSQDREIGVRLVFTSPSGDGLKIICKTSGEITDRESYKREFETLQYFVSQKYSLPIGEVGLDKGISDITRGCLLCFDPSSVLLEWEDTFHPESHPLPPEVLSPRRRSPGLEEAVGREAVLPWDWEDFVGRLISALFDRIDSVFPEMSFRYSGNKWESPYKLDGNPAKDPRRDKTIISSQVPGVILEQGGERVRIIDYYMQKNSLQFGEAVRELSRLCGLEEEYKNLSRRYAQMKDREKSGQMSTGTEENSLTGQRNTEKTPSPEERFKDYLTIPDLRELASTKKEGIKTGYTFKDSLGREFPLILPSGGLTIVGGQSSHGKSRLLQNLSLQIAEEEYNKGGEGVVLYFAFEETLLEIVERFANIQINIPQLSQYGTSNTDVIRDYFQTGILNKCTQSKRREALPRLSSFVDRLYNTGRVRVYYTPDLYSGDLCKLLEYLSSIWTIKAVFLDYLQAIYKEEYRGDRKDELREVCRELNNTAKGLDIPIVLSAQLNRETPSPSEMSSSNIAESADITRYADTILLLWDSVKVRDLKNKDGYLSSRDYSSLQEKGFTLGTPGKLYTIIDKNRGSTPGIECILDYIPETGKIPTNEDLPTGETPSSGLLSL